MPVKPEITAVAMLSAENGGTEIIVRSDGAVFIRQDVAERVIERLRSMIADYSAVPFRCDDCRRKLTVEEIVTSNVKP